MTTFNASSSTNGRGSESWSSSWTTIRVDRRSRGYCRVTFDHPPINTITATTVAELAELIGLIEQDPNLNVVVFDSANPDFYLAHYDTEHDPRRTAALPRGPTGLHAWLDLLVRLSRASVVSIASIRGRVRGAGSEYIRGCEDVHALVECGGFRSASTGNGDWADKPGAAGWWSAAGTWAALYGYGPFAVQEL